MASSFSQLSLYKGHPVGFNPVSRAGSIREMTNSSGAIESQLAYDPYGRVAQLQGSISPDFQYAGYYEHAPSGENLTLFRAYNATSGRWINRDPSLEDGGVNLYGYLYNNPLSGVDLLGLQECCVAHPTPEINPKTGYPYGYNPFEGIPASWKYDPKTGPFKKPDGSLFDPGPQAARTATVGGPLQ